MNQLAMNFDLDLPLARASDPITSFQAADKAKEFKGEHCRLILAVLAEHGSMGKDGIASRCKLTGVAVARRLPELLAIGRVALTGKKLSPRPGILSGNGLFSKQKRQSARTECRLLNNQLNRS